MGKAAYPTGAEVRARLALMGVSITLTDQQAQDFSDAAASRWESLIGYSPFFGSQDMFRQLNPPNNSDVLVLPGPMHRVDSVTIDGNILVAGEDYYAAPTPPPYLFIRLDQRWLGDPLTVEVNGLWGIGPECPDEVYQAVLECAVGQIIRITQGANGSVSEVQQESVKVKFGGVQGSFADQADARMMQLATRYQFPIAR